MIVLRINKGIKISCLLDGLINYFPFPQKSVRSNILQFEGLESCILLTSYIRMITEHCNEPQQMFFRCINNAVASTVYNCITLMGLHPVHFALATSVFSLQICLTHSKQGVLCLCKGLMESSLYKQD